MKALKFFLFLCILTINSIAQDILQDTLKLVIVSQKVGTLIDRTERDQYHMMSSVNNFVSASFYITDSGKFYSRIESSDDSGTTIMTLQEYPEAVLFRLAEKINNYEDIMDRSYLIGQEPVTVYVVGGDPITWEPKVSMQIVSNKAQTSNLNESTGSERGVEFDSIGISAYKKSEVHITYGYGIGKGAPPSSSYDETVVYDSYSTRQIANVKDKYLSLGEGMRFEARYLYFFKEDIGAFFEIGYSYGHLEKKVSYKYVSTSSTYSVNMVDKVSFKFYTVPILAGVHFRLPSDIFSPFGGIGIGIWLPSKQTVDFSSEVNTIRYEGIQKNEMNTPLGFISYLGFAVNLKPDVDFFIQAKTSMITYYVQRSEITKYTRNGEDYLQSLSMYDKITVYEANRNYKEDPRYDPASPRHGGAPYPIPASTVSFVAGLSFAY